MRRWSSWTPTPARRCAATGARSGRSSEDDVANLDGRAYAGVDLLAGGVPCPPFSIAGSSSGRDDERDLFPQALRLVEEARPRAVLLENVRGLAARRFDGYRSPGAGAAARPGLSRPGGTWCTPASTGCRSCGPGSCWWRIRQPWAAWFRWPAPSAQPPPTVGGLLADLMAAGGWPGAAGWARPGQRHRADDRRRQQEARRPGPGPDPGPCGLEAARRERPRHRRRAARARASRPASRPS